MDAYRSCLRPLLFRLDAEGVHEAALRATGLAGRLSPGLMHRLGGSVQPDARIAMQVAGMSFANPVGLAAGFDKSGRGVRGLVHMGFGCVEIGSVSARPSQGNARPRLFRLPQDDAIIVNYGVPNDGAAVIARRLAAISLPPRPVPIGINLVETNTGEPTDPDEVVEELIEAAGAFCGVADYLTLNLNCPNTTAGVSPFDDAPRLQRLLDGLAAVDGLPAVFLKFTAHRDARRADALLAATGAHDFVAGFIFNLPAGKAYRLRTPREVTEPMPGTLCGRPTQDMMDATLRFWYPRIDTKRHIIIGSGGIFSAEDAYRKIRLGASLVQLYTALVFHGPGLVGHISRGLAELLVRDDLSHLSEAVGLDHP